MRIPILPTLLVAAAVAVMIGLGIWQIERAEWKSSLLERYAEAAGLPAIAWPAGSTDDELHYFRKSGARCEEVQSWRPTSGQNRRGEAGWSFIATCRIARGAEAGSGAGDQMQVDMGWSRSNRSPDWRGGEVSGTIAPDSRHGIRLISDRAAPGFQPSGTPSPATIPNNHLFYAAQWFFFAAAAALIYLLALRRRNRR